jgi:hypothetical protein
MKLPPEPVPVTETWREWVEKRLRDQGLDPDPPDPDPDVLSLLAAPNPETPGPPGRARSADRDAPRASQ